MRMRMLLAVVIVMAAPLAEAGSAEAPEITDPGTDAGSRPGMDVTAVWLAVDDPDVDDPVVRVTFKLAGDPRHTPALFAAHEELRLNLVHDAMPPGTAQMYVSLRPSCTSTTVVTAIPTCLEETASCRLGRAAEAGKYEALGLETAIGGFMDAGDQMGCTVTYTQLGITAGSALRELHVAHSLIVRGPLSSGDTVPVTVLHSFDRAPDVDFGLDFIAPAAPVAAPSMTYANITGFPFLVEATNATSGIFQYNWTGDGVLRFFGAVTEGNLTINVTAGGNTAFVWDGTEGLDEDMSDKPVCVDERVEPVPCDWTFTYELSDFVGMYGIDFAVNRTMDEANATDGPEVGGGDGNVTGNGTADLDGATPGKESPNAALPFLLIALIVVARRRK